MRAVFRSAAAIVLVLLAALPLLSHAEETEDLLRSKIVASLEKHHPHHHRSKAANPCLVSQTAFGKATESLLSTTIAIYSAVLTNGWKVPKCPANPVECEMPTNTTTPVDLVAVFVNLEVADQSQTSLGSLFITGNANINLMDSSCVMGESNKCSWSNSTSVCG